MKVYVFCLLALLAFVAVPAAQTVKNDTNKDDARLKELDAKIQQQQKALAELELERNRIIQRQADQKKKRYLKVEIRGNLEHLAFSSMDPYPKPKEVYCIVVQGQARLGLELRSQELKELAAKCQGKEVILSGTGYKSSWEPQPQPPHIFDTGFAPRARVFLTSFDAVAVDSLKLAEP